MEKYEFPSGFFKAASQLPLSKQIRQKLFTA